MDILGHFIQEHILLKAISETTSRKYVSKELGVKETYTNYILWLKVLIWKDESKHSYV